MVLRRKGNPGFSRWCRWKSLEEPEWRRQGGRL
jgi:hypothetical protein